MADSGETPHASNDHSTNGPRGLKTYNLRAADTPSAAEQESHAEDEPSLTSPASIASPPYWVQSHTRSFSNISVESVNGGITLLDNTDEGSDSKTSSACWAKHVYIEDHTVINGSRTGIGAFVVWNVTVETLHGSPIRLRKRYSEFDSLREKLLQTFPRSTLPDLPRKSLTAKFRPKFLEERREGLQYFLNSILLNPEFSSSPVLKEFVFS